MGIFFLGDIVRYGPIIFSKYIYIFLNGKYYFQHLICLLRGTGGGGNL